MDLIDALPSSEGKDKIFVVVDRLTKFAHFTTVKKTDTKKNCGYILQEYLQIT